MRKSKILTLIAVVAIILTFQTVHSADVNAVTIIGENTSMIFEVLGGGGSYAPYTVNINPDGAYCMRDVSATFRLSNNLSTYGVQNVYFTVQGWCYPNSYGPVVTVQGTYGNGNWSGVFSWSDIGAYDSYTVKCHGVDNSGNIYFWSKTIKHDTTRPTFSGLNIISDGLNLTGTDGKNVVNNNITVSADIYDNTPYSTSWIKQVQMKLYEVGKSTPLQNVVLPMITGDQGYGDYRQFFNLVDFGLVEKKLYIQVTATDYAGNQTTSTKYFSYDRLSPRGAITKGTETSTSVEYYFTAQPDYAGMTFPTFYFWTEANDQDDLEAVNGQQVSANVWKATLYKSQHGNQTGLYNIHVWTRDIIDNFNYAAATTYQMN